MPKISIIIPVYNVEQYLSTCLDSILAQTFTDFEVLLIDDGSPDKSGEICDYYTTIDARFKTFHIKNSGVSFARNLGLEHASGYWISFIDSDDWVASNYCERIISLAENIDLLYFTSKWEYSDGNKTIYLPYPYYTCDSYEIQAQMLKLKQNMQNHEYFGYTWNKLFKREIIEKYNIKFINGLSTREDEIFTYQYLQHTKSLKIVPEPLYHYRVLSTGLTHRKKNETELSILTDKLEDNIKWIQNESLIRFEKKRIANLKLISALNSNDFIKTIKLFSSTWNYYNKNISACKNSKRIYFIFNKPKIIAFILFIIYRKLKA